jgi:hypothetical protein
MRWIGHVAHMGKILNIRKHLVKRLKGRDFLDDPGIEGMVILN